MNARFPIFNDNYRSVIVIIISIIMVFLSLFLIVVTAFSTYVKLSSLTGQLYFAENQSFNPAIRGRVFADSETLSFYSVGDTLTVVVPANEPKRVDARIADTYTVTGELIFEMRGTDLSEEVNKKLIEEELIFFEVKLRSGREPIIRYITRSISDSLSLD